MTRINEQFWSGYAANLGSKLSTLYNMLNSDILDTLVSGRRLRDISDLPFDLAI